MLSTHSQIKQINLFFWVFRDPPAWWLQVVANAIFCIYSILIACQGGEYWFVQTRSLFSGFLHWGLAFLAEDILKNSEVIILRSEQIFIPIFILENISIFSIIYFRPVIIEKTGKRYRLNFHAIHAKQFLNMNIHTIIIICWKVFVVALCRDGCCIIICIEKVIVTKEVHV